MDFNIDPTIWLHLRIDYYIQGHTSIVPYDRIISKRNYHNKSLSALIAEEVAVSDEDSITIYASSISGVDCMYPVMEILCYEDGFSYTTGLSYVDLSGNAKSTVFEIENRPTYKEACEAGYESLKRLMEEIKKECAKND